MSKRVRDYSKLRGRIREIYGTQAAFAEDLGLSNTCVSGKLNNETDWKLDEIEKAITILHITDAEILDYFFCTKS